MKQTHRINFFVLVRQCCGLAVSFHVPRFIFGFMFQTITPRNNWFRHDILAPPESFRCTTLPLVIVTTGRGFRTDKQQLMPYRSLNPSSFYIIRHIHTHTQMLLCPVSCDLFFFDVIPALEVHIPQISALPVHKILVVIISTIYIYIYKQAKAYITIHRILYH